MSTLSKDDRLIYLVFTAQHRLRMHIRDELKAAGVKITLEQAGILFLLEAENGQAMSQLSRLLLLDNSTITGLIDRLEKSGFVLRKANPKDRRIFLIHITQLGIKEVNDAKTLINRVNEQIKTDFSDEEIETFKKILNSFVTKFKKA
ncbi:MAG: MarR family transcriptional regulator [Deltaproteobacteria bacterium]|nr:MarR family transcriptional regulator [Deltaproteobacteria bacterium]